jgi:hypothetical protein
MYIYICTEKFEYIRAKLKTEIKKNTYSNAYINAYIYMCVHIYVCKYFNSYVYIHMSIHILKTSLPDLIVPLGFFNVCDCCVAPVIKKCGCVHFCRRISTHTYIYIYKCVGMFMFHHQCIYVYMDVSKHVLKPILLYSLCI